MPCPRANIALLVFALACRDPRPRDPGPDRAALAAEADDRFNAGDLAGSDAIYQHLLHLESDAAQRVEIQRRLAKIAWEQGQPERAVERLEAALGAIDPDDPLCADLAYEIAKIDLRAGRIEPAMARFEAIEASFWPSERGRWGVYWARLRLAAIAIHQARPQDARALLAPFLDDDAFLEQIQRSHARDLLYVAAFVSIACRELGEPERAWTSNLRFRLTPAAPELRLVFQAEEASAAWAAGQPEQAEALLAALFSQETCDLHRERYQIDDLPDFVDPDLSVQPFAQKLIAHWRAAIGPSEQALAAGPPRIRLTLARPGDGFVHGVE